MASKVVIVTGASRGIGLATAKHLLRSSHKVVLVSRSQQALEELKKQYPSQVEYLAADLTDFDNAPKVTELAKKSFGRLDGLIINHGVLSPMKKIADSNVQEWKGLFDANFFSAIALLKEAIPLLRESKGRVVFTSSGAATGGYVSWGPYGSSKAGLNSLARHLAGEEPLISSISISPGRCDTPMQAELREHGKGVMADAVHKEFVKAFEEGKLVNPEDPARVFANFATAGSLDLSGQYLKWDSPELAPYRETS